MIRNLNKIIIVLLLTIFLPANIFLAQYRINGSKKEFKETEKLQILPPAKLLKIISLNQTSILSDILWLRVIQYMGEKKQTERGWLWFSHTIDIITDLDPEFSLPYQFGGLMFSIIANKADESIKILRKGVKNIPDNWFLPFLLGYNYFELLEDYEKAGYYIEKASTLPNSPSFLKLFASRLYSSSGKPENGIIFVEKLLESTEDEEMKVNLENRLKILYIERDLRDLNKVVSDFFDSHHRFPNNIEELISAGLLRGIPRDPFSKPYFYDRKENKIKSSSINQRLIVYKR